MTRQASAAQALRMKVISAAVASCFVSGAYANPTGGVPVSGTVSMSSSPGVLQVTNSPNSIINWQTFSISTGELTRFVQQSPSSAVLNRVVTSSPSEIFGMLQSNGRVFLINRNGILFGAGSQVDVAGLVASSLNLSNDDFLTGRMRFTDGLGAGSVVNQGNIFTPAGGHVYLVGPAVTNGGVITTPQGATVLAAGNTVELVNPWTPDVSVLISASGNEALNLGSILADSGRVGIYAGLINQGGVVSANQAVMGEDGSIRLQATGSTMLASGSVTQSSGALSIETGDLTVEGNVQSGPQTVNASGAVVVQNAVGSFAQLGATGGQTIHARSLEVIARDGGSALIANNGFGDQAINVAGGGASAGLDVRSLSGSGFASIANYPTGATQSIIVTDADHIRINGMGTSGANIFASGGTQLVSITGSGANAITLGSAGAQGLSTVYGASQAIVAGAPGQAGSISMIGSEGNSRSTSFVTQQGSGNWQAVSTAGFLSISGGTAPAQTASAGLFHNGTGPQTVNAAGIVMQGGSAGSGNGAFVNSSGSQQVNAGAGGITLIGGAGGTSNSAGIFQTRVDPALTQSIAVSDGGSLTLRGGSGGASNSAVIGAAGGMQQIDVGAGGITLIGGSSTGANNSALINQSSNNPAFAQSVRSAGDLLLDSGDAGERNFALIQAFGGLQSIDAGRTTLRSGAGGAANFAAIQAQKQEIGIHGDLSITAGGSVASGPSSGGAGIGGRGGAAPTATNLSLAVSGNLTLTGGSVAGTGASIGASPLSNDPTVIGIAVGGNVVLNPGTAPGALARIGTRAESPAGGNIDISALGSIALNSTSPDMYSFIRTVDGVTLRAREITQGIDARIQASSLSTETIQGTALTGANSIANFGASNFGTGTIALINASPLLTVTNVSEGTANPLQINQSGDLLVTGNVQSGPQTISTTGGLTVRGDATSAGQLSANGGQTINAGYVEVNAAGGRATIDNFGGDQRISTTGTNAAGEGLVVRNSGGGFASIQNTSGQQIIDVRNADRVVLDSARGTASVVATNSVQTFSVTGMGDNALVLGSPGSIAQSIIVGGTIQTVVAGQPGERGSITIYGTASGGPANNFIVSAPVSGGTQTVSTSGALTVFGGSAPSGSGAGVFANGTGQQTINAQSIVLQGGSIGTNNSAQIGANNGTQLVNAGAIGLHGGSGGTGNTAQIRANQGQQTIVANQVAIMAGSGGTNNSATFTAPAQNIAVAGDLTLTGGGSLGTPGAGGGARIGGRGGVLATPTSVALTVGGNVKLTGGTVAGAGAAIGSSPDGGQPTQITMNVGGDVTLNPGAVAEAGTRIGSPVANVASGEIVVNAGGAIALNSAGPGNAGAIRTADGVTLRARQISQGADSRIQANALNVETAQGASLAGANAVNSFNAANTSSGAVALNNSSALLTVTGIEQVPTGALSLNQAGNLLVTGNVTSGAQNIAATGDITITPGQGPNVEVHANGAQSFTAGGKFSLLGGSAWNGYAQTTANGPVQVSSGGDTLIQGGSGLLAYGLLYSKDDIRLTVGNELHLNGGTGLLAFARVQTDFWDKIFLSFPNRESGGYFVDGHEGVTRKGLDGFYTGLLPAVRGHSLILDYGD